MTEHSSLTTLKNLELSYRNYQKKDSNDVDVLRRQLKHALLEVLGETSGTRRSFAEVLRLATEISDSKKRRTAATLLLRSLEIPEVVAQEEQRIVVEFLDLALPDVARTLSIDPSSQTFQKWRQWSALHGQIATAITSLSSFKGPLRSLIDIRRDAIKAFALHEARTYSLVYPWSIFGSQLRAVIDCAQNLIDASDQNVTSAHDAFLAAIETLRKTCLESACFVSYSLTPLLCHLDSVLPSYMNERHQVMGATIRCTVREDDFLAKAYPLYDPQRDVTISIPFLNEGPSTAIDVKATFSSPQEDVVLDTTLSVGNIPPGSFAISIPVLRDRPVTNLLIAAEVTWTTAASDSRQRISTHFRVESQREDIPWSDLEISEPYSTGVAEGAQFVGRREKVRAIAGRFLRTRMQSTYVTGQKRIGKTSLALAVRDYVASQDAAGRFRFIELEWGQFARSDPQATVLALGNLISGALNAELESPVTLNENSFLGTLAPLIEISKKLQKDKPDLRFIVILDEFDEIHPEMYRFGRLAEAIFSNLRTLSSQRNIAFLLVGGEKMPFVMGAQGDQLNQFVREELTYFSRAEEWEDLRELITSPLEGVLTFRESAISDVATLAAGHPYYTKLLCARVFRDAVRARDADITHVEVESAVLKMVSSLDVNAFAHYWKDGISAGSEQEESIALSRSRLLSGIGRLLRSGRQITAETLAAQASLVGLPQHEIQPHLNEFLRRGIIREANRAFQCNVPIFEHWLREVGATRIIVDTLGDDLAETFQSKEEAAYVRSEEIVALVDQWPTYRGRKLGTDDVRQWIEQVQSREQQRYLFTILQRTHVVGEWEVREKLSISSRFIRERTQQFVRTNKSDRRNDIVVTYVDGAGKSGAFYASKFAEENYISSRAVLPLEAFGTQAAALESSTGATINAVVIVDDIMATGATMAGNLERFLSRNGDFLRHRSAFVGIIGLFATAAGESKVRRSLQGYRDIRSDVRICEHLTDANVAFPEAPEALGIWRNTSEREKAKALCLEIGARIYKKDPLGFGGKGLLLVFPNTVPNNTLPILHSRSKSASEWKPLFERPVN